MDLDFKSIKALASPTRLEILNKVFDEEATTTKLSKDLGKSKSTISNHLKVLTESGLLEKDEKEGRKRVIYQPTSKAKAIVEGKERKVKFSVISSALSAVGGAFLIKESEIFQIFDKSPIGSKGDDLGAESAQNSMTAMDSAGGSDMGSMSTETVNRSADIVTNATANTSDQIALLDPEKAMLVLGTGLLTTSVLALGYTYILGKLRS